MAKVFLSKLLQAAAEKDIRISQIAREFKPIKKLASLGLSSGETWI